MKIRFLPAFCQYFKLTFDIQFIKCLPEESEGTIGKHRIIIEISSKSPQIQENTINLQLEVLENNFYRQRIQIEK